MKLIDYSFARPDPAYIKSQGFGGVMRYLSHTVGKNLSIAERDALFAQGLGIGLVWETTANRALDGHSAGVQDATDALNQCNNLGMNCPIYFAVDFDATPAQQTPINDYLNGARTILGDRVGVYGGFWIVKRCFDAGIVKWGWQTYAWSGGQWDARAQVRQTLNGQWNDSVDFDDTTTDNWGGQFPQAESALYQGKVINVAPQHLNIRSGASTGDGVVGQLNDGATINIYEESNGWDKIDGGWVFAQYVQRIDPQPVIPQNIVETPVVTPVETPVTPEVLPVEPTPDPVNTPVILDNSTPQPDVNKTPDVVSIDQPDVNKPVNSTSTWTAKTTNVPVNTNWFTNWLRKLIKWLES
jgi:uncharacterized protein YraI